MSPLKEDKYIGAFAHSNFVINVSSFATFYRKFMNRNAKGLVKTERKRENSYDAGNFHKKN